MQVQITHIKFPNLYLETRDAHKLRGFFGNLFRAESPLLHNHFADGSISYKYPLVQYKVIDKIPYLIGIEEGGRLLIKLFLKIKFIEIENQRYDIQAKNITNSIFEISRQDSLHEYEFKTLWMALNQKNFAIYKKLKQESDKKEFLNKNLQNNILSFYKGINYFAKEKIMVKGNFIEKTTKFKNEKMLAFSGKFVTNAALPNFIGIGKSTARGFGSITLIH